MQAFVYLKTVRNQWRLTLLSLLFFAAVAHAKTANRGTEAAPTLDTTRRPTADTPGAVAHRPPPLTLRAWDVPPNTGGADVQTQAALAVIQAFRAQYPDVNPVSCYSLYIPGRGFDTVPLMQIAGDMAPDVLHVNFRQSDTFIRNKFLHPLDRLIEDWAGVEIPDGCRLSNADYRHCLEQAPRYAETVGRLVPAQAWDVIRRECPYGKNCPFFHTVFNREPLNHEPSNLSPAHSHIWALPQEPLVMALFYRKDLFAEAGLPDRPPRDWNELLEWSRKLTNPKEDRYGLRLPLLELGRTSQNLLYSAGGRVMEQQSDGQWRCVFDSDAAVEAYYFLARLFLEPFDNEHGRFSSVVSTGEARSGETRSAMFFDYLDERFFAEMDPTQAGFGPLPLGPDGKRGGEFNCRMSGIYAGLDSDPTRLAAAWDYIRFRNSPEATRIQARVLVENGLGRFVRPDVLRDTGYAQYLGDIPKGWEEALKEAVAAGVPEPYGKNCQMVYRYLSRAVDQIRNDDSVRAAIANGHADSAKTRIREILQYHARRANEKMLGIATPEQLRFRSTVATCAAVVILLIFAWVFHRVFTTMGKDNGKSQGKLFAKSFSPNPFQKPFLAGLAECALRLIRVRRGSTIPRSTDSASREKTTSEAAETSFVQRLTRTLSKPLTWLRSPQFAGDHAQTGQTPAELRTPQPQPQKVLEGGLEGSFLQKVPSSRRRHSHSLAWLLLLPALLSIALWAYYPLARGTLMAFQDYNIRGFSRWVGMENFAAVLFDDEFWYSLRISLEYAAMYLLLGFTAPIALAFLLSEIPRGRLAYRLLYYMPAVLSGVIVVFLWKGFYGQYGMINQVLNGGIHSLNWLFGTHLTDFTTQWLSSPRFALFFCLLPSVWAGLGPGCLIYLAALKTIPEEIYEAADIDGAGIRHKITHIALPAIKPLLIINFVGAMIGAVKSGSEYVLALTGGGPYTPYGQTEVVGLHIFWEAFGYLRFGSATAMAWVLGSMLVGFTVFQLQRLSRMEFRNTTKNDKG